MDKDDILRLDHQLCFPLYSAARKTVNLYTPILSPLGITYTQYLVFLVLFEKDGITVSELGKRLYLDSGTLSPLLKKMEKEGYVLRMRSKEDERTVVINLTEKGKAMKEKLNDVPLKIARCMNLDPEDATELYALLYKVLNH